MSINAPPHEWDLTDAEKDLIHRRAELRNQMKTKFQKHLSDPYVRAKAFDPAIQRWYSMKAISVDNYKPVPRNMVAPMFILFVFGISAYFTNKYVMRFTNQLLGIRFGKLHYVRGRAQWVVSPYQLNAYKNFFKKGIPANYEMLMRDGPYFILPLFGIYLLMKWAHGANRRAYRKKPGQFDNEVLTAVESD